MRIERFDLIAYGPFSDTSLDLSAGAQGLHVIHGENEAGKSTSLRGLIGWLFGIPERTGDAHRHHRRDLRLGGLLRRADGGALEVVRRKGRDRTLLAPDDENAVIDDAELAAFVGGMDEALFRSLYGIDHDSLAEGARAILEQRGELGSALFAAALGSARLQQVLAALEQDAEQIFKAQGKKPLLNQALAEHRALRKRTGQASLSARQWDATRRAYEEKRAEQQRLDDALAAARRELTRLERLERVLPPLHQRSAVLQQLARLGDGAELAADERRRVGELQSELARGAEAAEAARIRRDRLVAEREAVGLDETLLPHGETIERLYLEMGAVVKARSDRGVQDARLRRFKSDLRAAIADFRPGETIESVARFFPLLGRRKAIDRLLDEHLQLDTQQQQLQQGIRRREAAVEQGRARLQQAEPPADRADLLEHIATAQDAGDLDAAIHEIEEKIETERRACQAELDTLGLWPAGLAELASRALPARETAALHEQRFAELAEQQRDLERQRVEVAESIETARAERDQLLGAGELPALADLEQARQHRQAGWALVRRAWLEGERLEREVADYDPGRELPAAYERAVVEADELADRLRLEAERVQQHESLSAEIAHFERRLGRLARRAEQAAAERAAARRDWTAVWAPLGMQPLSPVEMRAWLERAEALQRRLAELQALEHRRDALLERRRALCAGLAAACAAAGGTAPQDEALAPALRAARSLADAIAEQEKARHELELTLAAAEQERDRLQQQADELEARREHWRRGWAEAIAWLEMGAAALPDVVAQALAQLEDIRSQSRRVTDEEGRLHGIDLVSVRFGQQVDAFAERIGRERGDDDAVAWVEALHTELVDAGKAQARLEELGERIGELEQELAEAELRAESLGRELAGLRQRAGAADDEALDAAVRRSEERDALRERLAALDDQIATAGDGIAVDELERQIAGQDPDALPARSAGLREEIAEHEQRRNALADERAALGQQLEAMDGSAAAAEAGARARQQAAAIRDLVRRYLRQRAAALILQQRIEQFRSANQAPMLSRASTLFQRLTLGSFAALRDDLDAAGRPVLLGQRPDGRSLTVEQMSDGTRDQLYLALRLSALESHLRRAEPMPFVVDDILIGFDDPRTAAALEVLAELSAETQVLLFTHHRHVAELAQQLHTTPGVFVHELA